LANSKKDGEFKTQVVTFTNRNELAMYWLRKTKVEERKTVEDLVEE